MIYEEEGKEALQDTLVLPAEVPNSLRQALETLRQGGVVAFPTDTVYGVGCLAFDAHAIERLFEAKARQMEKAIPVLIGDVQDLERVTLGMNALARRLADHFWPGPLTLVVPRHPDLPENLSPLATVGVRMPDHPVALALLRLSGPMAVTSANLSGGANSCTAEEVLDQLGGRIDLVLDGGQTPGGQPSSVVDCTGVEPRVLRVGPIGEENILAALSD